MAKHLLCIATTSPQTILYTQCVIGTVLQFHTCAVYIDCEGLGMILNFQQLQVHLIHLISSNKSIFPADFQSFPVRIKACSMAPLLTTNTDGKCHLVCCTLLHYSSLVAPWSSSQWQAVSESGVHLNTDGTLSIHFTFVVGD